MNKEFKTHENYKLTFSQPANCTLRLLDKNWKSFFKAIKDWKLHPEKYLGMPKLPKYLKKDGRFPWMIPNNQCFYDYEKGTVYISNCCGSHIEAQKTNRFIINGENQVDYLDIESKNIVLNGKLSNHYHGNMKVKTDLFIADESVLGPSSYEETIIDADSLSILDSKIYSESLDLYYKNIYVYNSTLNAKDIALNESLHHFDKLTEIKGN